MGAANSREIIVKNDKTGRYEKRIPGRNVVILPECKFQLQVYYGLRHDISPGEDPIEVKVVNQPKINKYITSSKFKSALNSGFRNEISYYGLEDKYQRFEVTHINSRTQMVTIQGSIILAKCMNIAEFTEELENDTFDADWLLELNVPNTNYRVHLNPWYNISRLVVYLNCI